MILGLHINQSKYHLGRWFSPRSYETRIQICKICCFYQGRRYSRTIGDICIYMFIYTHAFTYYIYMFICNIFTYIYIDLFIFFLYPCIYIYCLSHHDIIWCPFLFSQYTIICHDNQKNHDDRSCNCYLKENWKHMWVFGSKRPAQHKAGRTSGHSGGPWEG